MPFLENFNPFVDKVPSWPLKKLDHVAWRASRKLTPYHIDDLRRFAREIADAIQEEKELYVEVETQRYVNGLAEHGGWELGYLPDGSDVTRSSIAWLLENWPGEADEQPSLPEVGDVSDIDALQQALDYDHFQSPFRGYNDWPALSTDDALMVPVFALFSIMKVEEALEALSWGQEGKKWLSAGELALINLSAAADAMAEAMEALFTANLYFAMDHERRSAAVRHEKSIETKHAQELRQRQEERSARAVAARQKALAEKNARFAAARDWIWDEWQLHQSEYEGSRTAFARTYVRLVADRFTAADGTPMMISERTVWEKWTKAPRVVDSPA